MSTPAPAPAPSPAADPVRFTFECGFFDAGGTPTKIDKELVSFEETWSHQPETRWCEPIQHGTEFTDLQREAVALAGDVLPLGIEQLGGLYSQCAMSANGYLQLSSLGDKQAQEVRGFLHLCPDRPGADQLRAMLG